MSTYKGSIFLPRGWEYGWRFMPHLDIFDMKFIMCDGQGLICLEYELQYLASNNQQGVNLTQKCVSCVPFCITEQDDINFLKIGRNHASLFNRKRLTIFYITNHFMFMAILFATSLSKWHWFKTTLSRLRFQIDGDALGLFYIYLAFEANIPILNNTSVYWTCMEISNCNITRAYTARCKPFPHDSFVIFNWMWGMVDFTNIVIIFVTSLALG